MRLSSRNNSSYSRYSKAGVFRAAVIVVVLFAVVPAVIYFLGDQYSSLFGLKDSPDDAASAQENSASCSVNADTPTQNVADNTLGGSQEITDVTGPGDSLYSLLIDNLADENIADQLARTFASTIEQSLEIPFDHSAPLQVGKRYSITVDRDGKFLQAALELEAAHVFHAALDENGLRCWKEEVVLDFKTETISFEISGTLTESVLNTGEGPELALKLSNLFRWDIDFQSESVRGDVCKVLFERRYADDRPSGYGRILCAVYEGKKTGTKTAVLFNNEYYDSRGLELKKNFLRSPLSVIRVTSRYGRRYHPVLRVWRKHNGVDYGAAQGTPVWSISSGVVTFAGWQNGYGNYVCIRHDNGYESRYGHLHRIFVAKGQRVKQRQRIGSVGMTGLATGAHLDFQLLVNNKHVNPLNVKMAHSIRTVPAPLNERFSRLAQERLLALRGVVISRGMTPDVRVSVQ